MDAQGSLMISVDRRGSSVESRALWYLSLRAFSRKIRKASHTEIGLIVGSDKSAMDLIGMGARKTIPPNLPLYSGRTLLAASAEPVESGTKFIAPPEPLNATLCLMCFPFVYKWQI